MSELREFYEKNFFPARLREKGKKALLDYNAAISALEETLGRPAKLSDLNDANLSRIAASSSRYYLRLIGSLWRYAALVEAVDTWPGPAVFGGCSLEPRRQALLSYFEETFAPDRQADGSMTPGTVRQYRAAITAYLRFVYPRSPTCDRVSAANLMGFAKWQQDIGISEKTATDRTTYVRAVARHACPERWLPKVAATDGQEAPDDALHALYRSQYLPAHPGLRANTVLHVDRALNRFSKYLGRVATASDLTDENLGGFMRSMIEEGRSVNTVNGYRSKVRALWQYLAEKRIVDKFPTVEKIATPQQIPDAWSQADLMKLFRACNKMPGLVAGVPAPDWWRALLLVAWSTGERTGAVLAIRFEWIADDGHLEIPGEFRKGGVKAFLYRLMPAAIEAIDRIRKPERELVFDIDRRSAKHWYFANYKRLLKSAGLPTGRRNGLQKVRRSFASHIEAAGGDATAALAHSERGLTVKSYLDPRVVGQKPAAELLFELK